MYIKFMKHFNQKRQSDENNLSNILKEQPRDFRAEKSKILQTHTLFKKTPEQKLSFPTFNFSINTFMQSSQFPLNPEPINVRHFDKFTYNYSKRQITSKMDGHQNLR